MSEPIKSLWVVETRARGGVVWMHVGAYQSEDDAKREAHITYKPEVFESRVVRYIPAESETCRCGHDKSRHWGFSDHDECDQCCVEDRDEPCSEYRPKPEPSPEDILRREQEG